MSREDEGSGGHSSRGGNIECLTKGTVARLPHTAGGRKPGPHRAASGSCVLLRLSTLSVFAGHTGTAQLTLHVTQTWTMARVGYRSYERAVATHPFRTQSRRLRRLCEHCFVVRCVHVFWWATVYADDGSADRWTWCGGMRSGRCRLQCGDPCSTPQCFQAGCLLSVLCCCCFVLLRLL